MIFLFIEMFNFNHQDVFFQSLECFLKTSR